VVDNPEFAVKVVGQRHPTLTTNNVLNLFGKFRVIIFKILIHLNFRIAGDVLGDSSVYVPAITKQRNGGLMLGESLGKIFSN